MIRVTLSSYNLGNDATPDDFDAWCAYVSDNLATRCGIVPDAIEVDSYLFGEAAKDRVRGGTEDQRLAIQHVLAYDLWDTFCSYYWPPSE